MATYNDFSSKTKSSKIVLCHIEPKQRLTVFSLSSGTIYKKSVNHFVVNVSEDNIDLTQASNASLSSGEWFFDATTNELYINSSDDLNPNQHTIVVTYRLFYANRPVDIAFDLNTGSQVNYEARLISSSPISKQLDDEQIGLVLETATNINLENTDGHFDEFYDVLAFENKAIKLWSWSYDLPLSEKKKLFDGTIQNKSFSDRKVTFSCKDFTYKLREPLALENFTTSDGNVPENYLNTPKRRILGQVKQVQCVPIDSILDGFDVTGTINITNNSSTITGSGTDFLNELSPADELIYFTAQKTYKFTVKSITSATQAILSSDSDITISSSDFIIKPKRPYRSKNRRWHIAGHKLRSPSTTVSSAEQANRFNVVDDSDFFADDLIEVNGEAAFIRRVNSNRVVLETNLQAGIPSAGFTVIKNPLSKAFVNGSEVFINRDWSLTNTTTDAVLELDDLVEFNIAAIIDIGFDLTFINGSRNVSVSGTDMTSQLKSRDWLRSDDISHTTWYEVLDVVYDNDTTISTITLRSSYSGANITTNAQKKNVDLIDDNSVITVDCIGLESSSVWVKTASDAVKNVLENDAGFTNLNTASFTESDNDAPFTLSYLVPKKIGGSNITIRDFISDINKSVFGSLTLNNDFELKYEVLTPEKPTDLDELKDDDITNQSLTVQSRNEIVRKVNAKFRPYSDKFNGKESFELYEFSNDFVNDLIGVKSELDITIYLYDEDNAKTIAQRYAFYNSLSQSKFTITGKLNLIAKELNSKILLNLDRLYKRLGNKDRRKIGIVNSVKNNGADIELQINDLGNAFNRGAAISDNTASDFSTATNNEKILYSYICDEDTLTPDITTDDEVYQNLIC